MPVFFSVVAQCSLSRRHFDFSITTDTSSQTPFKKTQTTLNFKPRLIGCWVCCNRCLWNIPMSLFYKLVCWLQVDFVINFFFEFDFTYFLHFYHSSCTNCINQFFQLKRISISLSLSLYLSVYLSLSINLSLSTCLSLPICLSLSLSFYLSFYLSLSLYFFLFLVLWFMRS